MFINGAGVSITRETEMEDLSEITWVCLFCFILQFHLNQIWP